MKNSTSRSHPLHVPRPHFPTVSQAVSVADLPDENVGDRLNAPMGVPRKAGKIVIRILIPEIIQQ